MNSIRQIINEMGSTTQIIKTIEELGELQQALCKVILLHLRHSDKDEARKLELYKNVKEEVADVTFMLQQMEEVFFKDMDELDHMVFQRKINMLGKLKSGQIKPRRKKNEVNISHGR